MQSKADGLSVDAAGQLRVGVCGSAGTSWDSCESGVAPWLSLSGLGPARGYPIGAQTLAQLPAAERRPAAVGTGLYMLKSASRRDS